MLTSGSCAKIIGCKLFNSSKALYRVAHALGNGSGRLSMQARISAGAVLQ